MKALLNKTMKTIKNKHENLRKILIEYGSQEFGDCIVDDICNLFNYPNTLYNERKQKDYPKTF